MMGLEPTTFCMASRRSSQLSYIRERGKYSRALRRIERLIDEAIGQLVVLAPHRAIAHVADLPGESRGLQRELPQRLVLHAILAGHLLHEQLRVGTDLDLGHRQLQ